jgi:cobalt/nickel transport system permease protein
MQPDSSGHRPWWTEIITAGIIPVCATGPPEIRHAHAAARPLDAGLSIKNILAAFVIMAVITGGWLSWFASTHPTGMEWSIEKVTGKGRAGRGNTGHCACPQRYSGKDGISPRLWFQTAADEQNTEESPTVWPGN